MDKARQFILNGKIGKIKHIDGSMSSGTLDLFGGKGLLEAKKHTFQPLKSTWSDPIPAVIAIFKFLAFAIFSFVK